MATFGTKKHAVDIFATDAPNPSRLTQNSCSVRFWNFGSGTKTVQKSAERSVMATFGMRKLAVEFFATYGPNPSRLTKNSCLARFWSFGTGTKNWRKLAG